ncbi:HAMP domain-containing sensor histidine kinase [Zunongwangia endophytica]|uniref:histidine kinase n=1 Tax=Zunongwangia endophytica TaxID=1808945 RepID=A0ABV8H813_9FLAO|nr:HAMP domain-containing sensor histidine kinase [Zunongwangia endophytica]MDN3595539.1 HAMP domain-containing sensor histidine kinase [Zunongwangia endophytica]
MKIRQKITLISSLIFGFIFLLSSIVIYIAFYESSKNIFFQELSRTAKISGMFYLERDELSQKGFEPIQNSFYNLSSDQEVSIFNENGNIAFNTKELKQDWSESIEKIKEEGELNFRDNDTYYHGLFYKDNQGDFVVLVKATNPLIQSQKKRLISILAISFCVAMIILIFLTYRLSKLAYKPVRNIIKQVNHLNLHKSPLQLSYKSSKDELEELFQAFNNLLNEIESSYEQQKNFVDFSSHELKTPLASIINQLEISLQRDRSKDEYRETSAVVLQDAQQLKSILESLLTLSNLNKNIQLEEHIRIDELIWEIIEKLAPTYSEEKFNVKLEISPDDFDLLQCKGNETLLYMALFNIIENAAKFSKYEVVMIKLCKVNYRLQLQVKDQGIGISDKDLKHINQPFYRGGNTASFQGNGLGMSIALKIFQLHQIQYSITSQPQKFTKIQLEFPQ